MSGRFVAIRSLGRTTLALGAVGSVALGAGVVALLSDRVDLADLRLDLGTAESSMDVRAGLGDDCFAEGSVLGRQVEVDIAVEPGGDAVIEDSFELCVRNLSERRAGLTASIADLVSFEIGECAADEIRFGDRTCGDGAPGEAFDVADRVEIRFEVTGGSSASCLSGRTARRERAVNHVAPLGAIPPGAVCRLRATYQHVLARDPDAELAAILAQTDAVQYDLVIEGRDGRNTLADPGGSS